MTPDAFVRFIEIEQESLRRFLLNLCGSAALADDLVQEAFIRAWKNMDRFRNESAASTWLFAIARNCFYDYCRSSKVFAAEAVKDDAAIDDTLLESIGGSDIDEELRLALVKLSAAEREALLLFYMEEKSLKQVAKIMGIPVNTAKSHIRRAKIRIKHYLEYEK